MESGQLQDLVQAQSPLIIVAVVRLRKGKAAAIAAGR